MTAVEESYYHALPISWLTRRECRVDDIDNHEHQWGIGVPNYNGWLVHECRCWQGQPGGVYGEDDLWCYELAYTEEPY